LNARSTPQASDSALKRVRNKKRGLFRAALFIYSLFLVWQVRRGIVP
jgi:hypothetical protein